MWGTMKSNIFVLLCSLFFIIQEPIYCQLPTLFQGLNFDFLKVRYDTANPLSEYDFIIVGSGSAGCVIANRLSEVGKWKILLLEAGKGEMFLGNIPALAQFWYTTDYNWGHKMERQDNVCLAMENQICPWPRGKGVGGSTLINYMIYTRGSRKNFDELSKNGNYGWSYEEVLPYFLKSEDANFNDPYINSTYHSKGGFLSVEHPRWRSVLGTGFMEAGKELGYEEIDYNAGQPFGVAYVQGNTLKGARHTAARAFLKPIRNRPNLHILTSAYVTKVLINPENKEAYGIEFVRNKKTFRVRARKEVILSAGAFNSPQLLMLSGIGPADHLEELGIPVIQNLPVGQTLLDHITYTGLTFVVNETNVGIVLERILTAADVIQWTQGQGPFTTLGGIESLGYIKTKISKESGNHPDIELLFASGTITADNGVAVRKWMGISDEFYKENFAALNSKDSWTVLPMLLHPKSKGYMKLKDSSPFSWPKFYGNYYSDPNNEDIDTMVEAIKEIIRFSETKAMQKYGSKLYDVPFRSCESLGFGSDDYWRCALRHMSVTLHHQIGTCKMGPSTDPEAVVDPELRVYGISRLRVADTSIIPTTLTAHVSAPTFMIGEKVSDMIKKTWNEL